MAQQWYVKGTEGVTGPLSPNQLRTLAAMGRLKPTDEVSMDQQAWMRASQLKGLSFGQSTPPPGDPPKRKPTLGVNATVVMRADPNDSDSQKS